MMTFLRNIFTSDKPESSKRFFGAIGYISAIVAIFVWRHDLVETLLFVSAGLLGLDSITKIWKKE
jgi:hypothetical protein